MVYSLDKNGGLVRQPLSLPPPLPGYDLPVQLPPSGPVSSPQPLSTKKVEVVSKPWTDDATELTVQSRLGCTSEKLIEKVETVSSKDKEKEKGPEWHVRALEIIKAGIKGRGDADKEEFTRLIETNRDKINDLVYVGSST